MKKPFLIIFFSVIIYTINVTNVTNVNSLTSGRSVIDVMSYRDIIFQDSLEFLNSNLLLGNNSHKYYIYLKVYDAYEHMHNSFLELFVNNGIIIGFLFLIFILTNITRENRKYILPIFIASMTQYFIFWGVSLADIIFIYFLLFYKKKPILAIKGIF